MKSIETIGIVGAGVMGRGILQIFAAAGKKVYCHDALEGASEKAISFVRSMIERSVEKGRMSPDEADTTLALIHRADSLEDLSGCDLVIEAILEEIRPKQELFAQLEDIVREDAILASNTSSLVVSEIAAECRHPERLAGLHFFNPVPLMKVAEVIAAVRTAPEIVSALEQVVSEAGHRAVVAVDQPGFLVNHAGRGLSTEGLRVLEECCASVNDIDTLMREAGGFRMGPFELMDLTGLDVSGRAMQSIYDQFHQEPRFRPSSLVPPRMAAGLYGRKTGRGWYEYEEGKKKPVAEAVMPEMPEGVCFWIDTSSPEHAGLAELVRMAGAELAFDASRADVIVIQPWGQDVSSYCADHGLDPTRTVALDPLPGMTKRRTLMLSCVTSEHARDAAHALLAQGKPGVTVINDSPGFVVQRIVATIVNIATNIVQRGIASVDDLEDAVRLGLGYPCGPLALGDRLGAERILEILQNMHALTGDPRYRPSTWLQRRVRLRLPLITPETPRH